MEDRKYSASGGTYSFWFAEFKKMMTLLNQGNTFEQIKDRAIHENLFLATTEARAKKIYGVVSRRVKSLNGSFYVLFGESDISNQKFINLISVMKTDLLFFEFVYEVYREKLIIGSTELANSDFRIFFKDKQMQSEQVNQWTERTFENLIKYYKLLLREAGVVSEENEGIRQIRLPIIDESLEKCLLANEMKVYYDALMGVR